MGISAPGEPADRDDTVVDPHATPGQQDPVSDDLNLRDLVGVVADEIRAPIHPDHRISHESGDAVQGAIVEGPLATTSAEDAPTTFDFAAFFLDYYERLLVDVARYCSNDYALAEDVVQETYLKAYQLREKLGEINNPYGWLWTVATRVAKDIFRSEGRRTQRENRSEEGRERLNRSVDEWDSHTWMLVVRQLPTPYREIMRYRFILRYSRKEIADELGVSVGTVHHRITEALRILRRSIGSGGEG